jgi:MFS family permease
LCMNLRRWFTDYTILLKNKNFIRHCYCATAALAGFFAYYAISPFLFEEIFGVSAVDYGWLAVYIGAFSALSRFINGVLVIQYGIESVIYCGIITLVIAGVLMLGGYFLQINNVWAVLAPMILFTIGAGLIFANSFAGAMEDFASMAGTASSLYGFLQILGTFGMTWVVTKFAVHNQFVLATALLFLGVSALVVFRVLPE